MAKLDEEYQEAEEQERQENEDRITFVSAHYRGKDTKIRCVAGCKVD